MDIVGQQGTKGQIDIAIASARLRNTSPPHMFFSGHAGCGKTSMAKEVAKLLGSKFISVVPESIKDHNSVLYLLDLLDYSGYNTTGDRVGKINPAVIFLDECHRLPMYGQEKLGIIMENFTIESNQAGKLFWVPYFTLIGATTLAGELSKPFLNRFKLNFFFEAYSLEDSFQIIESHAKRLAVTVTASAIRDIAVRGRGVPRIMVSYLERCRDMMYAVDSKIITSALSRQTFAGLGIDERGFNRIELTLLKTLYNSEKPLGLETLSIVTGESPKTIKNEIETYLVRNGYIIRAGNGRSITQTGKEYLEQKGYVGKKNGRSVIEFNYKRQ